MQKIIVQIDWYTKVVLTLIAVLLAGLLVKPYIITKPVGAYNDYVTIDNKPYNPVPVTIVDPSVPIHASKDIPVKGNVDVGGDVSAYITGVRGALTVVDWKEEKDYYKFIVEKIKKRYKSK